jgi:hypothetical protein
VALALVFSSTLGAWSGGPAAEPAAAATLGRTALVVFAPVGESQLAHVAGMSVGIMSASQGRYSQTQLLLDIGQGARIASSAYPTARAPALSLAASGAGTTGTGATDPDTRVTGATVGGWRAARRRAERAPQLLQPGLLAGRTPGGAGYAGLTGTATIDGALAAQRDGHVTAVSLGPASTLLARIGALLRREHLVVADLPAGTAGAADLLALARERPVNELLIVVQRVARGSAGELLWTAAAGLAGGGGRELSSQSTNERGLIASFDLAPTILDHLDLGPIPPEVRGKPIVTDGSLHSASLRSLMARLRVIGGRRLPALGFLLAAWALLAALAAPWPRRRAWAMRIGALGVLWTPVAVLVPAALEPSAAVEYTTIVLVCVALGAVTDALVPWPRAVLAPAVVAVVVLTADALAGTQLLMRSLLGPDPILGARFYGIGNELKSGLAVLVAAAVAAALFPAMRDRRAALTMACAGVLLAVVEGSARIGAGVGGVILVSFGFAVATIVLLPGALTRRRALAVLVAPVAGLVVLAAIDLATAHGAGHYTGSVLDASSAGELRDVIVRRYSAAWDELKNQAMPAATALALVVAVLGVRRRARLLSPVAGDPAWLAALAGGLAAGVVGALVEDSGPVLFVVAVFALGCVLTYLWGVPRAEIEITGAPSPEPAHAKPGYSSSPGIGSIGSSS